MRKPSLLAAIGFALLLCGCASTGSTVLEFDADGKVVKETRTSESVLHTLISSTKEKSVVMWEDSLTAYISVSSGTVDDPTPHGKIFAGKANRGFISMQPDQKGLSDIARIVQATKNDVSVNLEGVNSSSSKIQPGNTGTGTPEAK